MYLRRLGTVDQLDGLIGESGARAVQDLLKNVSKPSESAHAFGSRQGVADAPAGAPACALRTDAPALPTP